MTASSLDDGMRWMTRRGQKPKNLKPDSPQCHAVRRMVAAQVSRVWGFGWTRLPAARNPRLGHLGCQWCWGRRWGGAKQGSFSLGKHADALHRSSAQDTTPRTARRHSLLHSDPLRLILLFLVYQKSDLNPGALLQTSPCPSHGQPSV